MAKITPENIADLKALFQDNEKALGANFSQLIDFFNNNKVTDNGDGTFTAGTVTVDASKLYDLINNSSPNILPLDNEFTGKNTFDIAPINKANGKPYITADSVPQVDLSNYPTKDQLATKADDSTVLHSSIIAQPSGTDLNTMMTAGFFQVSNGLNTAPNSDNFTIYQIIRLSWGNGVQIAYNTNNNMLAKRTWSGGNTFSSWVTFANTNDVTTAVSTATANMVDSSKPTNFTAGLQSGGVDVATAADLKSIKDSAWRELTGTGDIITSYTLLYKVHDDEKYMDVFLTGIYSGNSELKVVADLSSLVNKVTAVNMNLVSITGDFYSSVPAVADVDEQSAKIIISLHKAWVGGNVVTSSPISGGVFSKIYYDKLI